MNLPSPGQFVPELQIEPITRTTLALFAGGSGDHNPVHIDSDAAHNAGYPDVFAHGMLSNAYLARMLTDWVGQERILSLEVRFTAITPVGAAPLCRGRITEVDPQAGTATLAVDVVLEDGTVTVTGEALITTN
ncbi:MaoC/PaaZ C-terminal domain-containing protein [Nocardia farcinica]|uniref:MaoC/PaaZ C-terminal domain-containing protein n=1 Tax=Nocardia farcinica TaxID=37329 RepID=UPI0037A01CA6